MLLGAEAGARERPLEGGVGVAPRHHRGVLGDAQIGLPQPNALLFGHVSTGRGISSLGACNFPHLAGTAINRLSDQHLRFLAVDRDAVDD